MTVNEAIRTAKARAPVITIGTTAFHIGELEFSRIKQVIHNVDDFGKLNIFALCVDKVRKDCLVQIPIDGLQLSPNTPETLRRMIYQYKDKE